MTRILEVRFLVTLVMTTAFIGCSSGSSSSPSPTSPTAQKYQDFYSLKSQIISAGIPLNAGRDFSWRVQESARDLGRIRLKPVQTMLHRYVRLGTEVEALAGTGAFTLPVDNQFGDDYQKARAAESIVDNEMTRKSDFEGERLTAPVNPLPPPVTPVTPNRPRIPITPRSDFNLAKATSDCAAWSKQLNRPCRLEKGRIENQLFVADPAGSPVCHCPSGTFEQHSDTQF